jgi:hypothetical protein
MATKNSELTIWTVLRAKSAGKNILRSFKSKIAKFKFLPDSESTQIL